MLVKKTLIMQSPGSQAQTEGNQAACKAFTEPGENTFFNALGIDFPKFISSICSKTSS